MKILLSVLITMILFKLTFGHYRGAPEHHMKCPRCKGTGHLPTTPKEERKIPASTLPKEQRCPDCYGFGHVWRWFLL